MATLCISYGQKVINVDYIKGVISLITLSSKIICDILQQVVRLITGKQLQFSSILFSFALKMICASHILVKVMNTNIHDTSS